MARKKLVADNADYVAAQISFLKDGTELLDPSACASRVLLCYFCNKPIPRFHPTLYYLAGFKRRRVCKVCYENYKQTFDIGSCLKKSREGGK